jgi:hypothetical protein
MRKKNWVQRHDAAAMVERRLEQALPSISLKSYFTTSVGA